MTETENPVLKLRYCRSCRRKTLQVQQVNPIIDQLTFHYIKGVNIPKVWYCPCCGKNWEPRTKTVDEEVK